MENVNEICSVYRETPKLHKEGTHVISIDEMTGIQALEHLYPLKPMKKNNPEKIEFEYKRHGTTTLIGNFEIGTGSIIKPYLNKTRTEKDFADNISQLVSTDINGKWIFITDQLNTHLSESLVKYIADRCGIKKDLGKKGKCGILKSKKTRKLFLSDKSHRIRFIYTPRHCSWLNQIEIWFGIINKKLLNRRSSFKSVEDLENQILDFIDYYNIRSKPFKWTYKGMVLEI